MFSFFALVNSCVGREQLSDSDDLFNIEHKGCMILSSLLLYININIFTYTSINVIDKQWINDYFVTNWIN